MVKSNVSLDENAPFIKERSSEITQLRAGNLFYFLLYNFLFLNKYKHTKEWEALKKQPEIMKESADFPKVEIDDKVYVARSSIQGAGYGLFAARAFAQNELITQYEGDTIARNGILIKFYFVLSLNQFFF